MTVTTAYAFGIAAMRSELQPSKNHRDTMKKCSNKRVAKKDVPGFRWHAEYVCTACSAR